MVDKNKEERGYKKGNKKKTIMLICSIAVLLILMAALFIFLGIKLEENISDESTNDSINADNKEGVSIKENGEKSDTPKSKDSQENSEAKKNYVPSECSNTPDLCSCLEEYISLNANYSLTNKEIVINNTGEMPIKDIKIDVSTYKGNESYTISKSRSRTEGWPDYGLFPGEEGIVSLRSATENFKYYRITNISITPFVLKEKTIDSFDTVECSQSEIHLESEAFPDCSLVSEKKNCIERYYPEEKCEYYRYLNHTPSDDPPKISSINCSCLKNYFDAEIVSVSVSHPASQKFEIKNKGEIPIKGYDLEVKFFDNSTMEAHPYGVIKISPGETTEFDLKDIPFEKDNGDSIYEPKNLTEGPVRKISYIPHLILKTKYEWDGYTVRTVNRHCGEEKPAKYVVE